MAKVQGALDHEEKRVTINEKAFESALKGIATGTMTYEGDPLLPIL